VTDTHYVIGDNDNSYIDADGKEIKLTGYVYALELEGNTLYVYQLAG